MRCKIYGILKLRVCVCVCVTGGGPKVSPKFPIPKILKVFVVINSKNSNPNYPKLWTRIRLPFENQGPGLAGPGPLKGDEDS